MKNIKKFLIDVVEVIAVSLIIVFLLFKFVMISAEVDGRSMEKTLYTGDRGVSLVIKRNMGINRFDICVIDTDKADYLLVKRVIGLPNETIEYKNNALYVNGVEYEEDFLYKGCYTADLKIELGDDEYLCLGDNRMISKDSRYYGPFNGDEIKSTGYFVFYPFERMGVKK